jgi:glyoxylase-like metal-dependent hydrolase (beta-lactamase superfamily II)
MAVFQSRTVGVESITVGPLEVNSYIVWDKKSKEAAVVDPGAEPEKIEGRLEGLSLEVLYIINTHGHFDHIGGNAEIQSRFNAKVAAHGLDAPLLERAPYEAGLFGMTVARQPSPDILLKEGSVLAVGGLDLKILHTPGHTRGSVCIYLEREGVVFTGDTLFRGGVGRTDLDGGSYEDLVGSIKGKLFALDDSVRVFPGHGPATTIGEEKGANPFMSELL